MGDIKLPDGKTTPDRRSNGARIKLDIGDWIKIITVCIAIILAGGNIKFRVDNNSEILCKQAEAIEENKKLSRDNFKDIESMKYLLNRIDRNVDQLLRKK